MAKIKPIQLIVTDIEFNLFSIIYKVEPVDKDIDINGKPVFTHKDIKEKDLVLKSNVVSDNRIVFAPINVKPSYYQKLLQKDKVFADLEYQLSYIYLIGDICGVSR